MRVVLDTHAWLWFLQGDPAGNPARRWIEDPAGECWVSAASIWEAAIKVSLGKLRLPYSLSEDLPGLMEENGFVELPVRASHAAQLEGMPFHHRDPFDRLLVAQCLAESLPIVSADRAFEAYGVRRLWGDRG
ncbi:MAG: type II toxin-antitoxin system VapC family toxin [Verrucomicrobiae bacterium]|nr:type II toxin-antitoxin system VapC family toxin [Verrucomicrobiae bacterium]